MNDRLLEIEAAIRIDPARRGLLSSVESAELGVGQLMAAAHDLAASGRDVGIVTGFAIPTPDGPLPETDGPPGAALLADVCRNLGMQVRFITDTLAAPAVIVAANSIGLGDSDVEICPLPRDAGADWCADLLKRTTLSHLIAIERPGPNHTAESILQTVGQDAHDDYCGLVALADRDCCHNMRGENIDGYTAPLHLLFEGAEWQSGKGAKGPDVVPQNRSDSSHTSCSIGICDGGNEIGMGTFSWEALHPVVAGGQGKRIACRVATNSTIIAGTSNWGAFALAAAVALLRGRADLIESWTTARHLELLEALVEGGPAVDGVTRERTATVDGLPFLAYMQPWERIREIVGISG